MAHFAGRPPEALIEGGVLLQVVDLSGDSLLQAWSVRESADVLALSVALTAVLGRQLSAPRRCIHLLWDSIPARPAAEDVVRITASLLPIPEGEEFADEECIVCGDPCEPSETWENCVRCGLERLCRDCRVRLPRGEGPCCLNCLEVSEVERLRPAWKARYARLRFGVK